MKLYYFFATKLFHQSFNLIAFIVYLFELFKI
jgi:hypothetical protein